MSAKRLPGLDGLRALAVLLVIVFHAVPWIAPAGFVGVDVFFVLSGFLITSLLLKEIARSGRVDYPRFWLRRARRLLPALLLALLGCSAAAALVGGDVLVGLGEQLFGGLTFTSNWVQVSAANDYFADSSSQLFANLWSLAIEEQFYLVWPLALTAMIGARVWSRGRAAVGAAVIAAGSLTCAVVLVATGNPAAAYYNTLAHCFGLMFGAGIAMIPSGWMRTQRRLGACRRFAPWIVVAAVAVIVVLAVGMRSDGAWPRELALLAASVLAAVAVLFVRVQPEVPVLGSAPVRWIADRSYGLYLWHAPLLVLAGELAARHGGRPWLVGAALLITVAVSAASYRFVESPIRAHGFTVVGRWVADAVRPRQRALCVGGTVTVTVLLSLTLSGLVQAPAQTELETQLTAAAERLAVSAATSAPVSAEAPSVAPTEGVTSQPITGDQVTAVGDSVMLASADALAAALPGIAVDAVVSRQLAAGLGDIDAQDANGSLRPVVVLGLGTNGTGDADDVRAILARLGPDRRAVVVTCHGDRSWMPAVNDAIRSVAGEFPNVAVADWDVAISDHPDWLAKDGIHPDADGAALYAETIVAALRSLE